VIEATGGIPQEDSAVDAVKPRTGQRDRPRLDRRVRKDWTSRALIGIGLVIIWAVAIGSALSITFDPAVTLGWVLGLAGTLEAFHAGVRRNWSDSFVGVFVSALFLVAGAVLLAHPHLAAERITRAIGTTLSLAGLLRICAALASPSRQRLWHVAGGLCPLLMGAWLQYSSRHAGPSVSALFLGVDMLIGGWTRVVFQGHCLSQKF
jgi:uncharacterized membrane protein HdeD (DUF308 family)